MDIVAEAYKFRDDNCSVALDIKIRSKSTAHWDLMSPHEIASLFKGATIVPASTSSGITYIPNPRLAQVSCTNQGAMHESFR